MTQTLESQRSVVDHVFVVSGLRGPRPLERLVKRLGSTGAVASVMMRLEGKSFVESPNCLLILGSPDAERHFQALTTVPDPEFTGLRSSPFTVKDYTPKSVVGGTTVNPRALFIRTGAIPNFDYEARLHELLDCVQGSQLSFSYKVVHPIQGRRFPDAHRDFMRVYFNDNTSLQLVYTMMVYLRGSAWTTSDVSPIDVSFLRRPTASTGSSDPAIVGRPRSGPRSGPQRSGEQTTATASGRH